jgi:hypothetical protein
MSELRQCLTYGGTTYRIGRSYDANGSPAQLTYPDNSSVAYNPNALGEPRQAGAYASAVAYTRLPFRRLSLIEVRTGPGVAN